MREDDIPGVVRLEESCGLNSRGAASYLGALQSPNSILLVALIDSLAERPRHIIGLFSGAVIVDELQIDNVAVAEQWRRSGVAAKLLTAALRLAHQQGATSAVLEVRSQNLAARALYEKHGFTVAGVRPAYYQHPPDNALLLACNLKTGTENAP